MAILIFGCTRGRKKESRGRKPLLLPAPHWTAHATPCDSTRHALHATSDALLTERRCTSDVRKEVRQTEPSG